MILHVDMDAFYASVEQRDDPSIRGKPVVVGGSATGRGVVSAANYEARRFGIHSAMPMRTAVSRCQELVVVMTRMQHYATISRKLREIFHRFTPLVEPLALDEAFLDVRGSCSLFGSAEKIGSMIRQQIVDELELPASVGIGPNKFIAKVASGHSKPNGFVVVDEHRVQEFLDPLPVQRIWGVGDIAERKLQSIGIHRVAQLRTAEIETLRSVIGKSAAEHLHTLAQGRDGRAVVPDREAKSISHETTFHEDVDDATVIHACLLRLTEQVARRLRRHQRYARCISIKIRFGNFHTVVRTCSPATSLDSTTQIWKSIRDDLLPRVELLRPVRLVGVGVSSLADTRQRQMELFDDSTERDAHLDETTDQIVDRFGRGAIQRGSTLRS